MKIPDICPNCNQLLVKNSIVLKCEKCGINYFIPVFGPENHILIQFNYKNKLWFIWNCTARTLGFNNGVGKLINVKYFEPDFSDIEKLNNKLSTIITFL